MRNILIFGPAYLDRVLRTDAPLIPGERFDGSLDGVTDGDGGAACLTDRSGFSIVLDGIDGTSRPLGEVRVDGLFGGESPFDNHTVGVVSDTDHLGGMGAGYARALGGTLISALGPVGDPIGDRVSALLAAQRIDHRPIHVADQTSDWSLIVSSREFGDKLAIGFRGCHSSVNNLGITQHAPPCDLLVVASLPNRLVAQALDCPARLRLVAPAMRNARDTSPALASLACRFDVLSLNRGEWEATADRASIREKTPIVIVTDGPDGCAVSFRNQDGETNTLNFPAFPRNHPPRDTNRAGEAFASSFVSILMDHGWTSGPSDPNLIREAATRGSAAAALVLDREDFGFGTDAEINAALERGSV